MDEAKRKKLEAQGYWVGDAADFVGLEPHERALIDLRSRLRRAVKAARARNGLTQAEVARAMGSTQARVAKVEAGTSREVSVEMMVRTLYAAGGSLAELGFVEAGALPPETRRRAKSAARPKARKMPAGPR